MARPRKGTSKKTAANTKAETKAVKTEEEVKPVEEVKAEPAAEAEAPAAPETEAKAEKKTPGRKAAEKVVTKLQLDFGEFDVNDIIEAAKADYKASNKAAVKTLNLYIKPEDKAAYYVINDSVSGKVDL